jgi:hypothetical protein
MYRADYEFDDKTFGYPEHIYFEADSDEEAVDYAKWVDTVSFGGIIVKQTLIEVHEVEEADVLEEKRVVWL